MNELVYVLLVEALVFGALSCVLVAQRIDVLRWPEDSTWPVLASSLLFLLLFALALLLVCGFIAIGRFVSFAAEVREACARSAGRLCTAAALAVVYVSILLAVRDGPESYECVLCQLCGTTCAQPDSLFWSLSYGAYLAVLLPAAAMLAGLIIVAAAMCKESHIAPRRLVTANCAFIVVLQVHTSLEHNSSRLPARCGGTPAGRAASDFGTYFTNNPHVVIVALVLYALDAVADILASMVVTGERARRLAVYFTFWRLMVFGAIWGLSALWDEVQLPWQVLITHTALAIVLTALDVADVWVQHFANNKTQQQTALSEAAVEATLGHVATAPGVVGGRGTRAAIEIEPARRRRFVLAFNNKSRWPAAPTAAKKAM